MLDAHCIQRVTEQWWVSQEVATRLTGGSPTRLKELLATGKLRTQKQKGKKMQICAWDCLQNCAIRRKLSQKYVGNIRYYLSEEGELLQEEIS